MPQNNHHNGRTAALAREFRDRAGVFGSTLAPKPSGAVLGSFGLGRSREGGVCAVSGDDDGPGLLGDEVTGFLSLVPGDAVPMARAGAGEEICAFLG